jgi:DNA polymerase III epsilon subunit-like protein
MNILFYDTETTGLPKNWKAHVHEVDNWPRLVQLAWVLVDSDTRAILANADQIIKPDGYCIPEAASKIHGISDDVAMRLGRPIEYVLGQFMFALQLSSVQVGHNIGFDWKIMGSELLRAGLEDQYELVKQMPMICTMMSWTKAKGGKWPKLQELHQTLFGEDFDGAHDAAADIGATVKCYFKMDELGMIVRPPALMGV